MNMDYDGTIVSVKGTVAEVEWRDKPPQLRTVLTVEDQPKTKLVVVDFASPISVSCMVLHVQGQLRRGAKVQVSGQNIQIPVGDGVLGRVFDIFGDPHDGLGPIKAKKARSLFLPVDLTLKDIVNSTELIETGIKVIDFFTPIRRGGKVAMVGGAGTGKTVVLTELINRLVGKQTKKQDQDRVAVFSAVGERSREALELYETLKEGKVLPQTSLVIGQMGENPAVRWHTAYAGAALVEHFRDVMSKDVLFFMDNIFRFAQAGQELATLMHLIPSEDGYQSTLGSQMADLNQRLVSTPDGSVTSFMALFVPSDDLTDAAVRSVIPYLDTIIILSRDVFQQGRYPAVDILASTAAMIEPGIVGKQHYDTYTQARRVLEQAANLERIVSLVGLSELSPDDQKTYIRAQLIESYMAQDLLAGWDEGELNTEYVARAETVEDMGRILAGEYDELEAEKLRFIGSLANLTRQPELKPAQ